jgi:hypothetical protein
MGASPLKPTVVRPLLSRHLVLAHVFVRQFDVNLELDRHQIVAANLPRAPVVTSVLTADSFCSPPSATRAAASTASAFGAGAGAGVCALVQDRRGGGRPRPERQRGMHASAPPHPRKEPHPFPFDSTGKGVRPLLLGL